MDVGEQRPAALQLLFVERRKKAEAEVIFNGEGGDPLFGGPKNLPLLAHHAFVDYAPALDRETVYLMSFNKGSQFLPQLLGAEYLAEAAFQLSDDWKQRGVVEKFALKEAVRDLLPASILARPKSGMQVPVHYWLRKELRKWAAEILLDRDARTHPILNRAALLELLNFRGGGVPGFHAARIWLLLSLEFWMQAHDIRA